MAPPPVARNPRGDSRTAIVSWRDSGKPAERPCFPSQHSTGIAPEAFPTIGQKQEPCVTHCYARLYLVPPEGLEPSTS